MAVMLVIGWSSGFVGIRHANEEAGIAPIRAATLSAFLRHYFSCSQATMHSACLRHLGDVAFGSWLPTVVYFNGIKTDQRAQAVA